MPTESVMPSSPLILCHSLLLMPSIFPSIRVFSNESSLPIWWPKCWSFTFSISLSNEYSGLTSLGLTGWISLQSKGLSRVFSSITVQKHQFFSAQRWSKSMVLRHPNLMVQLSHVYMTTEETIALTVRTFVGKVMPLLFNMLSRCHSSSSKERASFNFMAAVP